MKNRVTPNNNEVRLRDDEFIVSKTDTRGIITYVNRIFMQISGYNEKELLGVQHNLIRHPDMPRGAFKLMWDTLNAGEEFFAYVKNLCKDGGYYWVLANVTPDINADGKVVGFYSVRRKPTDDAIRAVTPLYRDMLEIEQREGAKSGPQRSIEYLQEFCERNNTRYEELIWSLDNP
ncbi:MAG: aerotaxis receptor Aer [Oceanospirillaceae bacterium]|jgi:PAS domain S-box-containing protein|uniref:PAS domain-containing protein n=1 Tax=Marinobacterium litorale TaxID=404770 RepID=UPI000423FCD9|nr:PAS domain-containing protein [Marinobacterium litorale]MBS98587.1 aerotaxis receptor Aer [Oceanospirillaceae bacterium]